MTAARYLLRFDDLCPTMNHERWARFVSLLRRYGVRAIVSVVPENLDPALRVSQEDPSFWNRMLELQDLGWSIAMHGYQHVCNVLGRSIVPIHNRSEFAGLDEIEQRRRIQRGAEILNDRGLRPSVWVAPRHGFDRITVHAVRMVGIRIISDGFHRFPYTEDDVIWIPQQLCEVSKKGDGVWTICFHPNNYADARFSKLERFLDEHSSEFTSVESVCATYCRRSRTLQDRMETNFALQMMKARGSMTRVKRVYRKLISHG